MKLAKEDPVVNFFQKLGNGPIPGELVNGQLPSDVAEVEAFVCKVYSGNGPVIISELRWELFCSRSLEGEMLPLTRGSLLPHLLRSNYMAIRDKSYTTLSPHLPPIEEHGWEQDGELYVPLRCTNPPAPKAVLELTKCGCKMGCQKRCSCKQYGLPCTPLCKCFTGECGNPFKDNILDQDG